MHGWPLMVAQQMRRPRNNYICYWLKNLLIIAMKIQIWHVNHEEMGVTETRQQSQPSLLAQVLRREVSRFIPHQQNEVELENMVQ